MVTSHSTPTAHDRARRFRRAVAVALATSTAASAIGVAIAPAPAGAAPATVPVTGRISVSSTGTQANPGTLLQEAVLLDGPGRFAVFSTSAALADGDTNGTRDAYLRDLELGTTTRVSLTDADGQITGVSHACGISKSGRYVAFVSNGSNLQVPGSFQLYLRDRQERTTELVSVTSAEQPATPTGDTGINGSTPCPVSANGRYVAFTSKATNLVPGDTATFDVYRRDRTAGTTERMSVGPGGTGGNGDSGWPAMSDDGLAVAFRSAATTFVTDLNGDVDAYVRLTATSTTVRASVTNGGAEVEGGDVSTVGISGNGSVVAFSSTASGYTMGESGTVADVYARDLVAGTTELISKSTGGTQATAASSSPQLSTDGRYVVFTSGASNLYPADGNNALDVFRRDRQLERTDLVSRTGGIAPGNAASLRGAISADGSRVTFASDATNLVRNDTNGIRDAFVRDFAVELAPFGSFDALVTQQFVDFAGRPPTATELTEWRARLANGERTPDRVILDQARSTAFAGDRGPLIRLYWAFFLRAPDLGGLTFWTNKLGSGTTLAAVAAQFAKSSEFQAKYGSKSNAEFVTLIYQNIFDRDPDAGGLAFWTKQLDTKKKTRGDVMVSFSESSEGKRVLAPPTDTVLVTLGMLRRAPSPDELTSALAAIAAGGPTTAVPRDLRATAPYAARITP